MSQESEQLEQWLDNLLGDLQNLAKLDWLEQLNRHRQETKESILRLFANYYMALEQRPIGDAIEIKVPAPTMRFVLNACKQSDRTIAKRILDLEQNVSEWRDVSNDDEIELQIWQLKILASLTGKYNWSIFLLKPNRLPINKGQN